MLAALGLGGGAVGFFRSLSAGKKAEAATAIANSARSESAAATTRIAELLELASRKPAPAVAWRMELVGDYVYALVNVGTIEAHNVTIAAANPDLENLIPKNPDHPTLQPGERLRFSPSNRLGLVLREVDALWNDDTVAHGQSARLRLP